MRRFVSLVLLVCLFPVQAFGAECPTADAVHQAVRHDAGESHGHHGTETPTEQSAQHPGDCGMMALCGSALLPIPVVGAAVAVPTVANDVAFMPSFYRSPSRRFDPPPPRLLK